MRVGTGMDVHAFSKQPGRPMMLACLEWPGVRGLEGHSDADVAAHAACDAILIASGVGDLGTVFGTDQPQWAGATGAQLLAESARQVRGEGWEIANVSVQIIGQRPRFLPRKVEAEETMSMILGAPVAISATTTDHLGFTGRNEGLAAIATALVYRA
ncbi:2-C-methyl-D-erythritol 2,4-cyclodiphosphate synthase [Arcanobacterium bovis]|uniref:2-C-methyl-D-erythritol 2,4-cyclodiphosphate synthase n=1 Tax=Arcanobacterium bovis TaxID=2529275 RepID=A0A4Q9V2N1_9ACTO|nr:2-C-methyl-D-erythritol 2,4-cyclodiphosphate synthase [Arcanobacterium bovis]TBW23925.1 2-C-methyl-D-erythritol 2,4-cyclodiphosphate synthase [Arcanobacterium bovis]